jgi:hypothetical protein
MADKDLAIRNTHSTVTTIAHSSPLKAWDENGNIVVLDESLISAEETRLQAVEDSQLYAKNRLEEYGILNQFEMQFNDNRDGTTTWVDKINEIKGRHPK